MSGRYFGKYTGIVQDNRDPDKLGRVRVEVPAVFPGEETAWARAALPYGFFFLPEVGVSVWVEFEGGDLGQPLWTGVQYRGSGWPSEVDEPEKRVIRTAAGHLIFLNDKGGEESVEIRDNKNGHRILLDNKGVHISTQQGQKADFANSEILLDAGSGTTAKLSASSLELGCGASKVTLSSAEISLESVNIELNGAMVKLGRNGALPILRAAVDMGVGNLGIPVILAPGNPTVKG